MLEAATPVQTHTRSFTWRKTTEADLAACLDVQPVHLGDELTGPEIAHQVWREILADPAMVTAVFECQPPIEGRRIVGFGAAVFVRAEFVEDELANPRPYINARVSPEERGQLQTLLAVSLAQLLAGYRLNRIFGQATDSEMRAMLGSNLVRKVASFPELKLASYVATEEVALAQPFSIQVTIFKNREPLLRLSGAEQELLWAALEGQTDAELAVSLHLTMPAVKARWRSIFARFARLKPEVAPEFYGEGSRGPQKRHRVLAYLRGYPEELRPFALDAGGDGV
jgi:hypothetical protein